MDNKRILEILNNPAKYIGEPIWVDMIFSVKRLMEIADEKFKLTKEEIIKELIPNNSGEEVWLHLNEDGAIVVKPYAEDEKGNQYGSIRNFYKALGIDTTTMILPDADFKEEIMSEEDAEKFNKVLQDAKDRYSVIQKMISDYQEGIKNRV